MTATAASRRPSLRGLLLILVAAGIGAGAVAGADSYQRHKRQIAFTRLIEDSCDACALRHAAQLRLREFLRERNADTAAPASSD